MKYLSILMVCQVMACATAEVMPEARSENYVPTGSVQWLSRGATFDAVRVRSPKMNLARRTDGSWAGTFENRAIDVSVTPEAVRGVDLLLHREREGHTTIITGQFQGRIVRFELGDERALIRTVSASLTFLQRVEVDAESLGGFRDRRHRVL